MSRKSIFLFIPFLLLFSCARSLTLETQTDIPTPLIESLQLNAAIYYPQVTKTYIYIENSRDRSNWSIAAGDSQIALFNEVMQSMFSSFSVIEKLEDNNREFDVLIVPTLKDMQFALPNETGLGLYEVWLAYELSVQNKQNGSSEMITITGYGSSTEGVFSTDSSGLLEASKAAYRELSAHAIVSLLENSRIQALPVSNALIEQEE